MIPRPVILTGLLGAAVAGPVAMNKLPEHWPAEWPGGKASATADPATTHPFAAPSVPNDTLPHNGSPVYRSPAPLEGAVTSISDALRLDVNPQWVYARWARKSTGLADPELFGVRAPLVTGQQMTDLAGAVSYYFDREGVAQRIRFHGRTADTTHVVALAVQRFGMRKVEGAPGEQLYQRVTRRGIESQLRTRPEAVLWGTSPHSSFVVDLEVNRSGSGRFVEPLRPQLRVPDAPAPPPVAAATPIPGAPTTASLPEEPAETADEKSGDGSLLGLAPGQLPRMRWPQ